MTDMIKRGDLLPEWSVTLTDDKVPIDLTTAASIRVIGTRAGVVVIDQTVTGNASGVITMPWPAGSTDVAGLIQFEVEVTWPGAKPQTFPPSGYLSTRINQDLD